MEGRSRVYQWRVGQRFISGGLVKGLSVESRSKVYQWRVGQGFISEWRGQGFISGE